MMIMMTTVKNSNGSNNDRSNNNSNSNNMGMIVRKAITTTMRIIKVIRAMLLPIVQNSKIDSDGK